MNRLIINTLSQTGKDVAYEKYKGTNAEYIRFFYLSQDFLDADDDEVAEAHYVQVDWFTPWNPNPISNQIKTLMKEQGFKRYFEHEQFEDDTKKFHKIIRFWKTKEE